jgi:hypothetical protein
MVDRQPPFEKNNVLTSVGDAVPEEDDLLGLLENLEVLVRLEPEGQEGKQGARKQTAKKSSNVHKEKVLVNQ